MTVHIGTHWKSGITTTGKSSGRKLKVKVPAVFLPTFRARLAGWSDAQHSMLGLWQPDLSPCWRPVQSTTSSHSVNSQERRWSSTCTCFYKTTTKSLANRNASPKAPWWLLHLPANSRSVDLVTRVGRLLQLLTMVVNSDWLFPSSASASLCPSGKEYPCFGAYQD